SGCSLCTTMFRAIAFTCVSEHTSVSKQNVTHRHQCARITRCQRLRGHQVRRGHHPGAIAQDERGRIARYETMTKRKGSTVMRWSTALVVAVVAAGIGAPGLALGQRKSPSGGSTPTGLIFDRLHGAPTPPSHQVGL